MSRDGALPAFALWGDSGDSGDSDVDREQRQGESIRMAARLRFAASERWGDGGDSGDSGDSDVDPGRHGGASVEIASRHRFSASAR